MAFKPMPRQTKRENGVIPPAPPPESESAPSGREEDLGANRARVVSIGYIGEFRFRITGEVYDEWMPRIAMSGDGLVPVLPCTDLASGDECLFIVPGLFRSWLRKQNRYVGMSVILRKKGKDPETGAYKLTVERM